MKADASLYDELTEKLAQKQNEYDAARRRSQKMRDALTMLLAHHDATCPACTTSPVEHEFVTYARITLCATGKQPDAVCPDEPKNENLRRPPKLPFREKPAQRRRK